MGRLRIPGGVWSNRLDAHPRPEPPGSGSLHAGLDPTARAALGQVFKAGEVQQRFHIVLADKAGLDAVDDGGQVGVAGFFVVLVHLAHVAFLCVSVETRTDTRPHAANGTRKAGRAID